MNTPRSAKSPFSSLHQADHDADTANSARLAARKTETAIDAALVQRFNAGDESAFTEIINRYYPRICALAKNTLHNDADAEEIAQDTFIRAHRALATFRGDCSLATWLHCIGLNLARNRYWFFFRRHRQDAISIDKTVVEGSSITLAGALSDGLGDPRAEAMTGEFLDLISSCMARLEASHRDILTMRTVRNLSYDEIATQLRINVGTVKSRIARARESLRELLLQVAPEFGKESTVNDFFEMARPQPMPSFAVA